MRVSELFVSLQGEGTRAGIPCAFIRLAGCNLACAYCDSAYAAKSEGEPREARDVARWARDAATPTVMLTGGEPLHQPGAAELLRLLCGGGGDVAVETNGSIPLAPVDRRARYIVDVKTPGSGAGGSFHESNWESLRPQDEIKFVITSRADFDWTVEIVRSRELDRRLPVLISPAWGLVTLTDAAAWILESRLWLRLSPQLHKLIWGPDRRGV
ncbi:MAG: radical SAM protein [Nitrospinae bacterium]|nr:radical SAM protein [Nitrospinota bacterium]